MTLTVLAFRKTSDGKLIDLPVDPKRLGDSTMAGFESTRQTFYGGEIAGQLNLKLLPQLKEADLWVSGSQLADLEIEVSLLLKNLRSDEFEYWSYRLGNISDAISRASVFGEDGVVHIG